MIETPADDWRWTWNHHHLNINISIKINCVERARPARKSPKWKANLSSEKDKGLLKYLTHAHFMHWRRLGRQESAPFSNTEINHRIVYASSEICLQLKCVGTGRCRCYIVIATVNSICKAINEPKTWVITIQKVSAPIQLNLAVSRGTLHTAGMHFFVVCLDFVKRHNLRAFLITNRLKCQRFFWTGRFMPEQTCRCRLSRCKNV